MATYKITRTESSSKFCDERGPLELCKPERKLTTLEGLRASYSQYEAWSSEHLEILVVGYVSIVALIGLFLVLFFPSDDFNTSRLYQSINADKLENLKVVLTSIISAYVPLVIVTSFEVLKGALRNEEKRRTIEARVIIFAFTLIPRIAMYAIVFPSPSRILLNAENLNHLCRCIIFLFEYQTFAVFALVTLLVAHKDERLVKPGIFFPLLVSFGVHSIMGQVLESFGNYDKMPVFALVYFILSFPFYIAGTIGFLTIVDHVWQIIINQAEYRGRRQDALFILVTSLGWYLFSWFSFSDGVAYIVGSDRDYGIDFFLTCSSLSMLTYIIVLFFHATEVSVRRVDVQERHLIEVEKREQSLQLANARLLHKERDLAVKLLYSIVPPKVADDLAQGKPPMPQMFDFCTIFFSDIVGFTSFSSSRQPIEVFAMLERLFVVMDKCVSFFPGLYKVETIGDAYLVVGGILDEEAEEDDNNDNKREEEGDVDIEEELVSSSLRRSFGLANSTAQFALLVRKAVRNVRMDETNFVQIRIGIHCGSVITGVIGQLTPHYCVFGDSVNTASRMESTGSANHVHVSGDFGNLLQNSPYASQYQLEKREPIEVKGKGVMQTYFLDCDDDDLCHTFAKQLHEINVLVEESDIGKQILRNLSSTNSLSSSGSNPFRQLQQDVRESKKSTPLGEKLRRFKDFALTPPPDQDHTTISMDEDRSQGDRQFDGADYIKLDYMGLPLPVHLRRTSSSSNISGFVWASSGGKNYEAAAAASTLPPLTSISFDEIMAEDFNVLQVDLNDTMRITACIVQLFKGLLGPLETAVQVDTDTLWRFVGRIGTLYQLRSYHNYHHAWCVTREVAVIIQHLKLYSNGSFSKKELFVILLSAVVHDVDHPGFNNDFMIRSSSKLALIYNGAGVLENHHIALTNSVMLDKAYNVFERWSAEERAASKRTITAAILATDMGLHKTLQLGLEARSAFLPEQPAFDLTKADDKLELIKVILHTADIFNPCRPFDISSVFSNFMAAECRQQVQKERALGLQVTSWMELPSREAVAKGEMGFAMHVAMPYFAALASCFPENSALDFVPAIEANVEAWRALANGNP